MNVALPLPPLEPKHLVWIVDAALQHFIKSIEEGETQIARHQHFASEPLQGSYRTEPNREERLTSLLSFLEQHRAIVAHLQVMRERAGDASVRASFPSSTRP